MVSLLVTAWTSLSWVYYSNYDCNIIIINYFYRERAQRQVFCFVLFYILPLFKKQERKEKWKRTQRLNSSLPRWRVSSCPQMLCLNREALRGDVVPAQRHSPSFVHQPSPGSLPPGTLLRKPAPTQGWSCIRGEQVSGMQVYSSVPPGETTARGLSPCPRRGFLIPAVYADIIALWDI